MVGYISGMSQVNDSAAVVAKQNMRKNEGTHKNHAAQSPVRVIEVRAQRSQSTIIDNGQLGYALLLMYIFSKSSSIEQPDRGIPADRCLQEDPSQLVDVGRSALLADIIQHLFCKLRLSRE